MDIEEIIIHTVAGTFCIIGFLGGLILITIFVQILSILWFGK